MVRVPLRCAPVLAATVSETVPEPLPLAPAVIVIHATLLAAVQLQPAVVVTAIGVAGPAASVTVWLVPLNANTQLPVPPEASWVIVTACPAIVAIVMVPT